MNDRVLSALSILQSVRHGVLATSSQELGGIPFGSLAMFSLLRVDGKARPVIFISDIAEHTKNLKSSSKCSLTVFEPSDNPAAHGRVTWVGSVVQDDRFIEEYLADHGGSKGLPGFHSYYIDCLRIRYIGGFGKIFWIEPEEWDTI